MVYVTMRSGLCMCLFICDRLYVTCHIGARLMSEL